MITNAMEINPYSQSLGFKITFQAYLCDEEFSSGSYIISICSAICIAGKPPRQAYP